MKKRTPPYHYFYLRDVSIPQEKILYFLCSNVKFNSVFYRCTNCLANSVLYSRDHKQGFILYCISTHWTIIRIRDCKENDIESVGMKNLNTLWCWVLVLLELWKLGVREIFSRTNC